MMAHTCPGALRLCTRLRGKPSSRRTAGGTSTCDTRMEKLPRPSRAACQTAMELAGAVIRSEEHTSELQSLRHLVCRLLLEKKTNTPPTQPPPPGGGDLHEGHAARAGA